MSVLVLAHHLVDRARHGARRADDLRALRERWMAQPTDAEVDAEELALARELVGLREKLTQSFGSVKSCHSCAKGHPLPFGRWAGGHCCGGETEKLFTDDELAAMKLTGISPSDLVPPKSEMAGCAFRGPEGCALEPVHRPTLCVAYTCRELEGELRQGGTRSEVAELQRKTRERLSALRREAERAGAPGSGGARRA